MKNKVNQFLEENLTFILCFGLILVIIIALLLMEQSREKMTQVLPTPKEQLPNVSPSLIPPVATLSFSRPENNAFKENISFSLKVIPQEEISASLYRLEILFDPQVLEVEKTSAGSSFKNPQILKNGVNNQERGIDFSTGINLEEKTATNEPKNKASLLAIPFRVKSLSTPEELFSTAISFGEKTALVNGGKEFKNLNQELEPIILKIDPTYE